MQFTPKILQLDPFPTGMLMEVTLCSSPSPTWRSVLWGLDLLKNGLGWRVGDGTTSHSWEDNWILGFSHFQPYSDHITSRSPTLVSDLINQLSNSLNLGRLYEVFAPVDVSRISSIPLPPVSRGDIVAWMPSKHDKFSVKRAYWFKQTLRRMDIDFLGCASPESEVQS